MVHLTGLAACGGGLAWPPAATGPGQGRGRVLRKMRVMTETLDLRELALRIRLRAVRMVAPQGFGYLGQALSSAEQVAAVFGTTCIALIPTVSFSGLLVPVSSLSGAGRAIGIGFPSSWFQQISEIGRAHV